MAFIRHDVDPVRLVGEARFLKHDADLHPIGRGGGKELQPIRILRRPARENWMIERHFSSHGGASRAGAQAEPKTRNDTATIYREVIEVDVLAFNVSFLRGFRASGGGGGVGEDWTGGWERGVGLRRHVRRSVIRHSWPSSYASGHRNIVDATLKSGSVAESCRGAHMSGGLSHCRPLIIVDNVPPESIRAAAHDIACRASKVNILAVGTFAIN